jgi:hypothetical protein
MASSLLEAFEDRRIEIPEASDIRDDLRKPEKLTTPSGRVSIAATRTEAGHADHFWALALAIRAASSDGGPAVAETLGSRERNGERRDDRPHVGSQRGAGSARMKKPNNKTTSSISAERVVQQILARFNPIRGLDPARLAAILDDYQRGYIAQAAQLWATIERRDPQCQSVIPKRKRATSLLEYEVLVEDDSPEAARQREALEYFYANVSATDALQRNMRGGFSTLVMQMMDAVGKGYAVHEILWKPARNAEGRDVLTAECVFTPLWFFENRTGSLRFLPQDYAVDGLPLAEGGWMVTVPATGIPLMEATSVAYVYKNLSLKDWLIFSERYGMPLPVGKTSASQGSPEWNCLRGRFAQRRAGLGTCHRQRRIGGLQGRRLQRRAPAAAPCRVYGRGHRHLVARRRPFD